MSKFVLTASAIAAPASLQSATLVISVTDDLGTPVTTVKKSWVKVSHLVITPKQTGLVQLLIQDFSHEAPGFYTMTLKPDPKLVGAAPSPGIPLAISVQKTSAALLASGVSGVVAEGYVTISTS